jgi:hypothetical protein
MADDLNKKQSPAQGAFSEFILKQFDALARERWAEEREWAQAGYFDQLKQWLEEDPQSKKLKPMTVKSGQKWPMPVTNHFSKTISANANSLGAAIPEMLALSDNYDARNRRAAEAAGNAIDAANRESGMEILNPTLARQTVLWGLGITEDTIAFDSVVEVPEIQEPQPQLPAGQPGQQVLPPAPPGQEMPPQLDPDADVADAPNVTGTVKVPTPRLKTNLLTVFQTYLPRDCQDPNLSPLQMWWKSYPIGELREMYPDYADDFKADDGPDQTLSAYYMNSLRSLSYSNRNAGSGKGDNSTLKCWWGDWSQLSKEVQEKISAEWEGQPSEAYEKDGLDKLTAAIQYGVYAVLSAKCVIEWGENPWSGDKPLTFFPWQKDCLSPYPKGLSTELVPLQKQLNRIDSLMERALMSNGTVKLLWPTTQSSVTPPSGDPVEVTYWDPLGEGKVKPEYFAGHAYGPELVAKRLQIVNDFKELGFTNSVAEGEMPGSGTAFRALAYLGAKAEETRKTQRYLWEQAHELRARKILKMAEKAWDEPRKIQTAGFNNRYGAQQLEGSDLQGGYQLNVIQDSSRPKTMTEKMEAYQMLVQGGLINPQDSTAREYVLDSLGLTDLDLSNHLQYAKAERDLQKLIAGIQPMESPFEKWDIPLKIIADYSLTEEFEALPDQQRNGILMYAQYLSDKLTTAQGGMMPPPMPGAGGPPNPSAGPGGQSASHVLGQEPGKQVAPFQSEIASVREGANVVPNSPPPAA